MPRAIPYLTRRKDTLYFRIAVPLDLRDTIGRREITRSLVTQDRSRAIPLALKIAAHVLTQFAEIRGMSDKKKPAVRWDFEQEIAFDELGRQIVRFKDVKPEDGSAVAEITAAFVAAGATQSSSTPTAHKGSRRQSKEPLLSKIIEDFLAEKATEDIGPMMKKLNFVMPMFLNFVGDGAISSLKQESISGFCKLVQRLPPRWNDLQRKQNLTIRQIADQTHPRLISKDTYDGTYRACMSMFIGWGVTERQDQHFPTSLTTEKLTYKGKRTKPEQKQRAFKPDELKRLFEGAEMAAIAGDPNQAERYWLPHIGLFTGARINEICQINPQVDIHQDSKGAWFIAITEETEGHQDIEKSVKTNVTRNVPIHQKLIELGLLDYIERIKARGETLMFPCWSPRGGRASPNAERWFNRFLKSVGLYGVKNERGLAIRGYHAFRFTLLSYGREQKLNLFCVSGHKERQSDLSTSEVGEGYVDDDIALTFDEVSRRLNALTYPVQFISPCVPYGNASATSRP